mmetsp:Transcript_31693/g.74026  ORF Transcript_31693/g.74026 Transcript_31693/m.74026 type:complete len:490 (-) Transcript_31693:174-1643(-)
MLRELDRDDDVVTVNPLEPDVLAEIEGLAFASEAARVASPAAREAKRRRPASTKPKKARSKAKVAQPLLEVNSDDLGLDEAEQCQKDARQAKKLRQAEEIVAADGRVEVKILCPQCRRDSNTKRQATLGEVFTTKQAKATTDAKVDIDGAVDGLLCQVIEVEGCEGEAAEVTPLDLEEVEVQRIESITPPAAPEMPARGTTGATIGDNAEAAVCCRCRRSLVVSHLAASKAKHSASSSGCPFRARLKQYKTQAAQTHAKWELTDAEAMQFMRLPCALCGVAPDLENRRIHGLTRLRAVECAHGMGPYAPGNVATACSTCNMIKGIHTLEEAAEICKTIATQRGLGDYGRFPNRFRDNISKRSRSAYIGDTARQTPKAIGTSASKTHCLTNEEFKKIVAMPCHYCGKASDPPRHHNGLDRLDNSLRLYSAANVVSCCGTCNFAKGKFTEDFFLSQCKIIAEHWSSAVTATEIDSQNASQDLQSDPEGVTD